VGEEAQPAYRPGTVAACRGGKNCPKRSGARAHARFPAPAPASPPRLRPFHSAVRQPAKAPATPGNGEREAFKATEERTGAEHVEATV